MRWRTASTGVLLVVGLTLYAAGAATLAGFLPANRAIELAYYAIAGIAWIAPAAWLIAWAARDDRRDGHV